MRPVNKLSLSLLISALFVALLSSCTVSSRADAAPNSPDAGTVAVTPDPVTEKPPAWDGDMESGWKEYNRLTGEQKYEAASAVVEKMLAKVSGSRNSAEWVKCLISYTQLRTALHGTETAVRFLREQKWPDDIFGRTVLNLYYARTLIGYADMYSWEIGKRERVESKGPIDLKSWTRDQIFGEAWRALAELWAVREELGAMPVGKFSAYVHKNTYPENIRPTMRDALTYLTVEMLLHESQHKASDESDLHRLDLQRLIDGQVETKKPSALEDGDLGGYQKVAALTSDLESWHRKRNEPEAAFEARLTRLSALYQAFTDSEDRALIKKDLASAIAALKRLPWAAVGTAVLAEYTSQEDTPDALKRGHAMASDCARNFEGTLGGARCLHLQKSIESPDYNYSAMQTDGTGKRSIEISHKNVTAVYFRAYRSDLIRELESTDDYNLFPSGNRLNAIISKGAPAYEWKVDLPPTPDYRSHKTFNTPPIKEHGYYVILSSLKKDFGWDGNRTIAANMVVSDMVLVSRQGENGLEVTVLSGAQGRPVPGATVFLYKYDWKTRHKAAESRTTDASGTVLFDKGGRDAMYFLVARKDDMLAVDPSNIYFYAHQKPGEETSALIYTDRSIYRPDQKVFWKVVAYKGKRSEGKFNVLPSSPVSVSLIDPNNQTVASVKAATGEMGTASGEFLVPRGRLLGRWRISTSIGGHAQIKVEEYKRPTFETKLTDPETPLRLNKPATFKGEARYYFGLPLTSGKAMWRVTRETVYPWWWYWSWYGFFQPDRGSKIIASGTAKVGEDGIFTFTFKPDADERIGAKNPGVTYRYSITADVTDEGGETRSATRSFRLGFVSVEAAVDSESAFFMKGERPEFKVKRTSLDGAAKPGRGTWRLLELTGPSEALMPADQPVPRPRSAAGATPYTTPGDLLRPRWDRNYSPEMTMRNWEDGAEKGRGDLTHGENGEASAVLPGLPPGAYRIRYETLDDFGAGFETQKEFIVAGKGMHVPLPMILLAEKGTVRTGGKARFLAYSGIAGQPITFETYRDGKRLGRRHIETSVDNPVIEIPMDEIDRGGIGVTLSMLRDHQFINSTQTVFVPWDNKDLKLEFSTFRDRLRPGQEEAWRVKVTGPAGSDSAVSAAELLAYMYDRSLDAFVKHTPPNPMGLYPTRTAVVTARAALGQASGQWLYNSWPPPLPGYAHFSGDALMFPSGYGIGGPGSRYGRYKGGGDSLAMAPRAAPAMQAAEGKAEVASKSMAMKEDRDEESAGAKDKKAANLAEAPADASPTAEKAVELRADFSETAFFIPKLITGADGSAALEFKVPESVTSWSVWVHAITHDLKSGSVNREAKTVKELMVRPYLPRFLREGDQARIKVVVNNASAGELGGTLEFDIIEPASGKSVLGEFGLDGRSAKGLPFTVPAGGGANLAFDIKAPIGIRDVAFKVTAKSGDFSDGELRPIPVLPGRMHLMQSRFVTLKDRQTRVMTFADLARNDDPTRINEQMVVTLDAQLFYSVLSALPYLVNYPYECTEQTLNRFLSTAILTSMFKSSPALEKMAAEFAKRSTRLEKWDQPDPNRKMTLEETPWLEMAKGGTEKDDSLVRVLDPDTARANRESALQKLAKSQTSSGGFPWFPGGPPSPYMTLYILHGFAKGLEFGVEAPKDMVKRGWAYLHRHYIDDIVRIMMAYDCCWEFITYMNYVLSSYPDDSWTGGVFTPEERRTMLEFSFRRWKRHAPYLKGYLALTLKRAGRDADAKPVWESVMDSAKTAEDQGTFWAPEDRSWLWYNDTIETHAFALRTSMEVTPSDPKIDGMVLWLLLNKKLNHWKSTRATAEVVYSLAKYMKAAGTLGIREDATVTVGNRKTEFVFEPDRYTGKKNQIVIPGEQIDPATTSKVTVEKAGKGFMFASATWHFSTEKMPEKGSGDFLSVTRTYFKRVNDGKSFVLQPMAEGAAVAPGDEVEVHISLRSKHEMEYVHLRDPRAAGFEPSGAVSSHKYDLGIYWYEEYRDSGTNFFFERLPVGEYNFKYRIRAATAGVFKVTPATLQPMYAPEFAAYSAGHVLKIGEGK